MLGLEVLLLLLGTAAGLHTNLKVSAPSFFTETFVPASTPPSRNPKEGLYVGSGSSGLAQQALSRLPELRTWANWYQPPEFFKNGHVHTIMTAKFRVTRPVRYYRELLRTPDGGSLALDLLTGIGARKDSRESRWQGWEEQCEVRTLFDSKPPPRRSDRPFLLLVSGLGGGSQDTYVRAMAVAAAERGWQVGVINMRACGGSPVTSPRFFSACRGSTDDLRQAIIHVRRNYLPGGADAAPLALVGWSNGGSIVINYLAEQGGEILGESSSILGSSKLIMGRVDAAASLVCPLNMPAGSQNLERWFHRSVYDRAIASSLAEKFRTARSLFEDAAGEALDVAQWEGLGSSASTFKADVQLASTAKTIREIDEALTRRCFGFDSVDQYYEHASSHKRLPSVQVPLMLLSADDDPIAPGFGIPTETVRASENVLLAVTKHGGHLGWSDRDDPWGAPEWVQRVTCGFLEAALDLPRPDGRDNMYEEFDW